MDVRSPFFQNVATLLVGVMFLNPIVGAAAELSVAAGSGATLGQAGNGVPIVNIAAPNGKGLSHNRFKDYNVGQQGLILNNATERTQSTQLGGIILGNTNLNGKAAGLILNEVTGGNASRLQGYTEVAGQSAHVVVANPHGISCDGCGFINTPRVTLSTGTPLIEDGRLDRFDVDGGSIAIEGQGLNAGNVDQFDLITRSAKINAELHANKLNVITGRNEVDAATLAATAKAGEADGKPLLAIDSSALGGMYAGAIRLVGTEAGVGVKLAGDMAASAGDIRIDANGKLTLARTAASGDLVAKAQSIDLSADTYAGGKADIRAQDRLLVEQSLAAAGDVALKGAQVVNSGVVEAGVKPDNGRNANADLSVSAQQVRNSGTLIGNRQLQVSASQGLDNRDGTLSGRTLTQVDAGHLDNRQGRILADQQLKVSGASLDNQAGLLQSLGNAEIVSADELLNRQGEILTQQDTRLVAGALDNSQNGLIAGQALDVQAGSLDNRAGLISAREGLRLNAGQVDNSGTGLINSAGGLDLAADKLDSSEGGEVSAKGDMHLQVGELVQQQGRLIGEAGLRLDLADGVLDNQGGLITARGPLSLNDAGRLDNRDGEISSNAGIHLRGRHLDNRDGGRIIAAERLDITAQTVDNRSGGLLSGWQGLSLAGGSLDNSEQGTLSSREGALSVALSGGLDNSGAGALVSQGPQHIGAASLDNRNQGILSSEAALELAIAGQLNNDNQGLISAQTLDITADQTLNRSGQISAAGALLLNGASLDNSAGTLSAGQSLNVTLSAALLNGAAGRLASGGPLLLKAASIDNRGGQLASQGLLELFASSLDNSAGGTLAANDNLDLRVEGTLDNSADGLIYSQQGDLHVAAGSLDNSAGTLQSQGALAVEVSGALGNRGGRLSSQGGNVQITAASLDNSAQGVLASLVGWFRLNIAGLFDNRSGTTQAQALEIAAGQVNNTAGHISALAGDTRVATGAFANQGGGLYATQRLDVAASRFDNQGAAAGQGGKVAAQTIDFGLSGALDNRHGLIEAGDTLLLDSASLDNRNGALRALGQAGNTRIATSSGALDNRFGRIEVGNFDFALDVAGLHNADGHILHVGNGTFGLSSANAVQAGGSLVSNGDFSLDATSWTHSGTLQARNLTLDVGTFNQTASGRLLATQSLSATGGKWTNQGLIASDGSLDLTLTGAYDGSGRLTSLGDLTLTAASIDLPGSASIAGGGLAHISATGLLTNRGTLTANDDLTLRAATLNNHGTLGSAERLRLYAPTLRNENGLIFSGGDMALRVNSFTNRFADVYSLGDVDLAKDDQGAQANRFDNLSGTLEAVGDFSLRSAIVNNARDVLVVNDVGKYSAVITELACRGPYNPTGDCDLGGNGRRVGVWQVVERDKLEIVDSSAASNLMAGGDMFLSGQQLLNHSSLISAGGNLTANFTTLENKGVKPGEIETTRIFVSGRKPSYYHYADAAATFNARHSPSPQLATLEQDLNRFIGMMEREYLQGRQVNQTDSAGEAYSAILQAGGDINIQASQNLENSVVRPRYAYLGGGNRVDTSTPGTEIATYITLNPQLPPGLQQQQINPLTLPGFSLPIGEHGLFRLSGQAGEQGTAMDGYGNGPLAQQLQQVQGLPVTSRPAGAHKYLIETNPALTDLKQFMGSDYLLANFGYDPDQAQKRLGDGLYEQRLIREAVVARTGQRYLAGLTSDEAMYRYLMDNAIASKDALGLSLGVTLSAEQVAALTHDIVWLEEYEVNGERVLVPVLYLAQAEGRLAANGALIQGRDVTLISGGDLSNQGTLRASGDLSATAANIANSGLIEANERLSLLAEDSIRNAQGGIIAGRDVSLLAGEDILNERSVSVHQSAAGNRQWISSYADSAARIEANDSLELLAERDVANLGGVFDSRGDLDIDAGRDVTIASVQDLQHSSRGSSSLREQVTQLGAQVSAGGDIDVGAGRDLAVIASRLQAEGDVELSAGNDVLIASAADESHVYGKSKKVTHQEDHVQQQASEISAGGSLGIIAGQDLNLISSKISANDEAYLVAGGELNLLAAQDYDYSLYQKKKKGSFGRKSFKRDETTSIEHVGSEISTGGDLLLVSGGDQTYQAAKLTSGEDLTLSSGGEIAFEGVKDLEQESHEKSKSSWAWQSAKGKGKTDETLVQSQLIAQGERVIQAVEGLQIDVRQVNQQTVSQTIDAMVQADPNLAWLKEMESRGDVDWQRVKEVHDSFKYSSSGLGAGASVVVAIVVAYFAGPMLSQGIGSLGGATAAAGSGTAMAASGTTTASAVAAGATAGSTVAAGWANVALTAAATGATSGAVISTINNRGDLGAVLKDVTSSDALKGYVTSALTAGFTSGVLDSAYGVTGDDINKVTKGFELSKAGDIAKFGSYLGAQGAVQAVAQTALQGGSLSDNLQTALTGQVYHLMQAVAFNAAGDFADGKWADIDWKDGSAEKIALHAVVGGLLSEATGSDFATGALAAGANEALVEQFSGLIKGDKNLELMVSQLIGVAAATATGGDPAKAAELAKNATAYNRQLHPDEKALAKRLAEQSDGKFTVEQMEDALRRSSIPGEDIYANSDMVVTADGIYDTGGQWIFGGDGQSFIQLLPEANVSAIQYVAENTSGYAWDNRSLGIQLDPQQMQYPLEFPGCIACAAGFSYSLNTLDMRTPAQMEVDQNAFTLGASSLVGLPISGGSLLVIYGVRPILTGGMLVSGFDAAGQVVGGGEYRPGQTVVAGVTGGLAYPLAEKGTDLFSG
ncbi:two-partner secretion domain-containing protein [Pseudomonas lopnurensis]|uniref:two-partner secretion domain-containing protein n=1 Tax=Pseudomonas lopnurensis TaxID=1477517 RepID=UPI0028A98011|nr:DUF637 domain-containing protein [Pseudomonas lopnurensis]